MPKGAQGDRARGPCAHEPQEKVLSCPRARREIGQEAPAHRRPRRKVLSCPSIYVIHKHIHTYDGPEYDDAERHGSAVQCSEL